MTAQTLPPPGTPGRRLALCAILLFPLAYGLLVLWLGQDTSWDFRNYHRYNAWAFLTGRYADNIDLLPSQGQFFFNPLLDIPFFWLSGLLPPKFAYFILGCVQGLNFPLLFMIAYATLAGIAAERRAFICLALAALGMLGGLGISEAGTQFNDNIVSLGIFASVLLILRNKDALLSQPLRHAASDAFLYALPAGLAGGFKLTCISFCAGACIPLLILTPDARRCATVSFCLGLGLLAGFVLTYGYWGWYLYTQFGSPMFPFFNAIFRSPLMPPGFIFDFPTPRDWTLPVFPFTFAFDTSRVSESWYRDLRIPLLYAFLLFLPLLRAWKKPADIPALSNPLARRYLLLFACIAYYVWLFTQTVARYLVPLEMLAPLLVVLCSDLLPLRHKGIVAAVLLLLLALTTWPGDWGRRQHWADSYSGVSAPVLPAGTTVIMAGEQPYAYQLPDFPPDVSYIRINSRGLPAGAGTGLDKRLMEAVTSATGPLKLYIADVDMPQAPEQLAAAGLSIVPDSCTALRETLHEPVTKDEVSENQYLEHFSLCDLVRR